MTYIKNSLFFILFVLSINIYALNIENIINNYENMSSFQANLEQINYYNENETEIISKGIISFKKNLFSIEYFEPSPQKIVIKNKKMYALINGDLIVEDVLNDFQNIRPDLLIKKYYTKNNSTINKNQITLILDKNTNPYFSKIEAKIKKNLITYIKCTDFNNNYVIYIFTEIKTNINLNNNIFEVEN